MEAIQNEISARLREWAGAARHPRIAFRSVLTAAAFVCLFATMAVLEASTSLLQSWVFHRISSRITFTVGTGPSGRIRFPSGGPFDLRRGYSLLPGFADSLAGRDYNITAQARMSPAMIGTIDHGLYPVYPEKTQGGLVILDREHRPIYTARFPERVYRTFDSIPPVVVRSLLYLENRGLLDEKHPHHNPAIEWDRLIKASMDYVLNQAGFHREQPGGSTLATQIEKFRHSEEGRTDSPSEKLKQMVDASLRAYHDGSTTAHARREIIRDYMNSVPLAARPDYGEIQGLQDGLRVWYGEDLDRANDLLADERASGRRLLERGKVYREVLSLFICQRRPSYYLIERPGALEGDVSRNLRVLRRAGMISEPLFDSAEHARLALQTRPTRRAQPSFAEMKATSAIRSRLLTMTGLRGFYDLDRLDLTVESTIDRGAQDRVTRTLQRVRRARVADSLGLRGEQLLARGDPAGVIYSFNLYERTPAGNVLRVQADNLDDPLDINEGVKLELGSTAKLRTLCNYLDIVAGLHAKWAGQDRAALRQARDEADDPIRTWAFDFLAGSSDTTLASMLEGAMARTYSGSAAEAFYTGGGLQTFENFKKEENYQTYTVREGLVHSVNLVYIRIMRDIVRYYRAELPAYQAGILKDPDNPARREYLARFADAEGRQFLYGFYKRYRGKNSEQRLEALVGGIRPTPKRLAVIFRSIYPDADFGRFAAFLDRAMPAGRTAPELARKIFESYPRERYNLADRGYLARIHPLELWLLEYLEAHPGANWEEVSSASREQRQETYAWLFKGHRKAAQDKRIRDLLEVEAFERIHADWRKLAYPFGRLVPSYATAIGSSADKPAALADLMGILVNDGMRYPLQRFERLHFATGTPFETVFESGRTPGERVMRPEVARAVRGALTQVVERGTAQRASGAFKLADGSTIQVGGKTGTGDNRYETFAPGGRLLSSKVVNRTATFVFEIGDRFFGTITAHVNGPKADEYVFTSALPAQMLKALAPDLMPLIRGSVQPERGVKGPVRASLDPGRRQPSELDRLLQPGPALSF